jgi:pyruvate kinase
VASEAVPGTPVLLADGLFELCVESVEGDVVRCRVVKGGTLTPRKGVNFPTLHLKLPSMTDKDERDLAFGVKMDVDWVSLSFVRTAEDVRALKKRLADLGRASMPVVAKLEKPAAIENLESILVEADAIMVARGDLGVELPPEEVPMIQKRIIRRCNQLGLPVITATQMLESMIQNPRPTRAEASDVANAIADGTDAVMLSGETAVGAYPVPAVAMMSRIAATVEKQVQYVNHPAIRSDDAHALSEALRTLLGVIETRCIVAFTASGRTALLASQERLKAPIYAFTPDRQVYQKLSLAWGVQPVLIEESVTQLEDGIRLADDVLVRQKLAKPGDRIIVVGGIPMGIARGNNTLKIHRVGETGT